MDASDSFLPLSDMVRGVRLVEYAVDANKWLTYYVLTL